MALDKPEPLCTWDCVGNIGVHREVHMRPQVNLGPCTMIVLSAISHCDRKCIELLCSPEIVLCTIVFVRNNYYGRRR